MTVTRPKETIRFQTINDVKTALSELINTLEQAKQNGLIGSATYAKLNKKYILPLNELLVKAKGAKNSVTYFHEQADLYTKIATALLIEDSAFLEEKRSTFALLVGELAHEKPNDDKLRDFHRKIMDADLKTHKPLKQISELASYISYASNHGLYTLCARHEEQNQNKAHRAEENVKRDIKAFSDLFNSSSVELVNTLHDLKNQNERLGTDEAEAIIQTNLRNAKNEFNKLVVNNEKFITDVLIKADLPPKRIKTFMSKLNNLQEILGGAQSYKAVAYSQEVIKSLNPLITLAYGDTRLMLNTLLDVLTDYQIAADQQKKFYLKTISPADVIANNVITKTQALKQEADEQEKFFEKYATKHRKPLRTYTAEKNKLAEQCNNLVKSILNNIADDKYTDIERVDKDIQAMTNLQNEYAKILKKGQTNAFLFKPKGTGEFATHINKQFTELKTKLEALREAIQQRNLVKLQ